MFLKKLHWTFKRHPFLYISRFWLLSKNSSASAIANTSYNTLNTKESIPSCFFKVNERIFEHGKPDTDLECIKKLVTWLNRHTHVGPGVSAPSDRALQIMMYGKGGVCSDIAQIFNNFCVINDIQVREWGTTSVPFNVGNGGHSFNEFYSKELQKWILIDASLGVLFYGAQNNLLSVLGLYKKVRLGHAIEYRTIFKNNAIENEQIVKNYLNSDITPFLICDYRNATYDRFLKIGRPFIPVFVIHFLVYLLGKSYHYKFPLDNYKKIFN
ncbi:transglutaminase superfamily protein [Gelidibacter sediminis]|uniref:Transglutaminase superfamily protein n=1 Tax=Gelidibacter sediminis TaxID=1608710 RepID=A0A4R7PJ55_9FLAO|nr:transglutaminase domain-containing protein [Gelidibacter sediminis]TDU34425.1 transglutaminase superfamily protein [Gelidibacter sediminis]